MQCLLPTVKGYPVIDGVVQATNVSFARFFNTSACGYLTYAMGNNPQSPDAVHPMEMRGTNRFNVESDYLVFFYLPNIDWINQEVLYNFKQAL